MGYVLIYPTVVCVEHSICYVEQKYFSNIFIGRILVGFSAVRETSVAIFVFSTLL